MAYQTFPTSYTNPTTGVVSTIEPEVSSGGFTRKFINTVNQFGDGFVQIVPRGINIERDEWALKFILPKDAAKHVREFLTAREGAEPFYWTPDNHTQQLFRCDLDFKESELKGESVTLTCKFIRWYGA